MESSKKRQQSEKYVLESIQLYCQKKHHHDIKAIFLSSDSGQNYVITVHVMSLFEYSIEFAHLLFERPEVALKLLNEGFVKAGKDIYQNHELKAKMTIKENLHVRLTALPSCPDIYRTVLPKCSDIGKFLCISGTVIRVTLPKMLEFRKQWRCAKCKYEFIIDVAVENDFSHVKPIVCPSLDPCSSKNFTSLSGITANWCRDYQEVKVQEQVQNLVVGTVPRSMWVILENDLVDACQPGNDVIISGVMHTRWQRLVKGCKSEIELVLVAHNVEVKNNNIAVGTVSEDSLKEFETFWLEHQSNPLQGRDFILSCLCPQVFGLYIVKLAVALVLAGGVQRTDNDSVIRGDSHLLLVGDPGTGKSQFLKYASKISRRSVLTSGIGTTSAGLTAAAVKDGGKWQLEAGALVLADGGICCIDEFNNIKEHDKASIHEAMEQQTISIAKAGLVCKLSTQCSILASTNPKGRYNKQENLSVNTAMASPLLSRFDVILVLLDTYDAEWDNLVSAYILQGKDAPVEQETTASWPMAKMRAYFSAVRNIKPQLTTDCDRVLQAYYRKHRSSEGRSAARTTPRLLQSLIRLAQGHARLMFRMDVLVVDAIVAITIMESSMLGFALFEGIDALHTKFPDDPELQYKKQAKYMLDILELHDLLKKEQGSIQIENRDQDIREIILTQMDPFFHEQLLNESIHHNDDELIPETPLFSGSAIEQNLYNSQNKNKRPFMDNEAEDSLDSVPNIDPFASNQRNAALSSKYFSDDVDVVENHEDSIKTGRESLTNNAHGFPLAKKSRNAISGSSGVLHFGSARQICDIPSQSNEDILQNDIVNPHLNLRKKNISEANNQRENIHALSNDVSTLSELNAMFSSDVLKNGPDNRLKLDLNSCVRQAKNSRTFDSFAFKPKPLLKTTESSFLNVSSTSKHVNANDPKEKSTEPNHSSQATNSRSLWGLLSISEGSDKLHFDMDEM